MTPEQTKKFKYWQTRTIVVTMVGYALYYFVRKNFNTAMPSIEVTFGITKAQLGLFLTLNGIIYGLSRFINGFIADRVSARKFPVRNFRFYCISLFERNLSLIRSPVIFTVDRFKLITVPKSLKPAVKTVQ